MQKILLAKDANTKEIFIAAAYLIACKAENAEEIVTICDENEETNVYSDYVRNVVSNSFSGAFSEIISLHIRYNVCDPVLDVTPSRLEAVDKVADILRTSYSENIAYA